MHVHAVRDVGASAISLDGDTAHADFPVNHLIDDRAQTLFKLAAAVANPKIIIDLGAGFDTGLDRLLVPSDHSIHIPIRVLEDDNSGFTSPTTLLSWTSSQTPGQVITESMTASSERYLVLETSGTLDLQVPQLVFSKTVTLDAGPKLEDDPDFFKANATRLEQNTGQSLSVQHGPQQRLIEYNYESPLEGTDLTKMKALVADVGMHRPFWVDPHSFAADPDADDPPIWMKFAAMPGSRNSILVPMSGNESKTYPISLIESLN